MTRKRKQEEQIVEQQPVVSRKKLKPFTRNHTLYLRAMKNSTVTFCYGPAGTGKTYIACGLAAQMLQAGVIEKIVLSRPAVECGEKLGYLPGEFKDKLGPFVTPLHDALGDFIEHKELKEYQENGLVEICPLAYMRGRTLRDAFIILDEAQNCTYAQLKMLLTRFGGKHPKVVITGDITQSDVPTIGKNPLERVMDNLHDLDGISICQMDERDIMRHPLVEEICKRL